VPENGVAESRVVWESGRFFGCELRAGISQAAVSGALLQGQPRAAIGNSVNPNGDAIGARGAILVPERNFSAALMIALLLWGAILGGGYLALS
jgi:hypothetical protein